MKLKSIQIKNYRSIEDSGKFAIDDITCLVGKNESGKTAILKAIEGINSFNKNMKYDKTIDYPRRHLNQYDEKHGKSPAVVCTSEWELDKHDIATLEEEFGQNCLKSNTLEVDSCYDPCSTWRIRLNEKNIIDNLCNSHKLNAAEKSIVANCNTVNEVYQKVHESTMDSEKLNAIEQRIKKYREQDSTLHAIDLLFGRMPSFVYFSHYSRMSGEVSLTRYRSDEENNKVSEGDEVFVDFLDFAGISIDDIENVDKHEEFKSKIEAASNNITDQIFEYWTQNQNLEIEFDVGAGKKSDAPPFNSGIVMRARVKNTAHRASVPFSERSAGFIWFFSFLVHFSQVKKHYANKNTNVIVLLDEPGLTLHAKAQYDLLGYIQEKLSPNHQIIYSTHSPFMILPERFDSIRTVDDIVKTASSGKREILGTKVSTDFLKTSHDTVFPLQSALGYEISQTLFIGKKVVLVEGVSDVLYLKTISNILKENNRNHLGDWVVCPAGSIDKIAPFINLYLAHGEKRDIIALTDYQKGHKQKVQKLRESHIVSLLIYSDFCDKDEADIEDLFEKSLYLKILKSSCNISIELEKIDDKKRVIKEVNRLVGQFSHYAPADWLMNNSNELRKDTATVKKTLEKFENIFKAINENNQSYS